MNETILYGVLVYPSELDEYLESIMEEPDSYIGEFYLDKKTIVGDLIQRSTYGDEEDFYLIEEVLDRARFPYNYYPRGLDENFVMFRLREGKADYGTCACYATFLEHKIFKKHTCLGLDLTMENNWDNQVRLCLEHRVFRILEGK